MAVQSRRRRFLVSVHRNAFKYNEKTNLEPSLNTVFYAFRSWPAGQGCDSRVSSETTRSNISTRNDASRSHGSGVISAAGIDDDCLSGMADAQFGGGAAALSTLFGNAEQQRSLVYAVGSAVQSVTDAQSRAARYECAQPAQVKAGNKITSLVTQHTILFTLFTQYRRAPPSAQ